MRQTEFYVNLFSLPRLAVSLPLAVLAVIVLIFINEIAFQRSTSAVANLEAAQITQGHIGTLMQQVLDAETGQRGFLLTGNQKHLPEVSERLEHLIATLNTGIALKRRIVEDLRPSSLSHLGLVASLEILTREFKEQSGLSISTQLEAVEMGGAAQLTVYRLVQESLTNIGKYAEATQVQVTLQSLEGYVSIDVKDNGRGFTPEHLGAGTHGLAGMRHRVEAIGGRLTVTSAPGAGARVAAVLPKDR